MIVELEQEILRNSFNDIRDYAERYGKPQGAGFSTENFHVPNATSAAYYPDAQVPTAQIRVGNSHVTLFNYGNPSTRFTIEGELTPKIQNVLFKHGSRKR